MKVYTITTGTYREPGRPFFYNFECDVPTLKEFCERLSDGEVIYGHKLNVADDGAGGLLIRCREEWGVGSLQIGHVRASDKKFWDRPATEAEAA